MFKIGNLVINPAAIAYVDLEAKSAYRVTTEIVTPGVRIYLKASDNQGNLTLFFQGQQAQLLREYFTSIAYNCENSWN